MARAGRPIIAVMGAAEPVIAVAAPCRAIVAIANAAAPLVATAKAGRPVIAVVGAAEPVVAVATPCRAIGGIALARAALSTWRILRGTWLARLASLLLHLAVGRGARRAWASEGIALHSLPRSAALLGMSDGSRSDQ